MLKIVAGIVIGGGGEPASANPEYKNCIDFACSVNILKNALTIGSILSDSPIKGGVGGGIETVTFPDWTTENPGCVAGNFNDAVAQQATSDAETGIRFKGIVFALIHIANAAFIEVSTNENDWPL